MPAIKMIPNKNYFSQDYNGCGTLSVPMVQSIEFGEGELTKKERKQVSVMLALDYAGLTLICDRMNRKRESFTDAYFVIRKQGELRTFR